MTHFLHLCKISDEWRRKVYMETPILLDHSKLYLLFAYTVCLIATFILAPPVTLLEVGLGLVCTAIVLVILYAVLKREEAKGVRLLDAAVREALGERPEYRHEWIDHIHRMMILVVASERFGRKPKSPGSDVVVLAGLVSGRITGTEQNISLSPHWRRKPVMRTAELDIITAGEDQAAGFRRSVMGTYPPNCSSATRGPERRFPAPQASACLLRCMRQELALFPPRGPKRRRRQE